ncbi:MAG: hypothetical protein US70_C0015G0015 [Parcubacteria group bacterium GW2011_GWD2_38_11]|nr:MAG: hypothetical protein US70_C0015G0015 [Parcubacteria group bacterium GW2011_GWD2_38_11]
MGGVRFDDDIEPWRAGGDNSRAEQKVVRYGPRPTNELEQYKMRQAIRNSELHFGYAQLLKEFNDSNNFKKRIGLLSKEFFTQPKTPTDHYLNHHLCQTGIGGVVRTPGAISFPEIGNVYRQRKIGAIRESNCEDAPQYFSFSDDKIIINKFFAEKEAYEEIASFFLLSLTLTMEEIRVENDLSRFSFSMSCNKDYPAQASLDASSL